MMGRVIRIWVIRLLIAALLLSIVIGFILLRLGYQLDWSVYVSWVVALIGASVSIIPPLQKQNLEELTFFRQLFKEFNQRYDKMNSRLNLLREQSSENPFTKEDENFLFDYFNLCGEEYFYYKQGSIPNEVWDAWRRGMEYYLNNQQILKLWNQEEKDNNSYYGLTVKVILENKRRRRNNDPKWLKTATRARSID